MELSSLYEKYGASSYMIGELITQTEHGVQAAKQAFAEQAPRDVVAAALLHDVGHLLAFEEDFELMTDDKVVLGGQNHEDIGADYLSKIGFSSTTCRLVRNHVNTKRYLAAKHKDYIEANLSEASRATLIQQGGPMSPSEMREWEETEKDLLQWHLRFREWDDNAKTIADGKQHSESLKEFQDLFAYSVSEDKANKSK